MKGHFKMKIEISNGEVLDRISILEIKKLNMPLMGLGSRITGNMVGRH